MSWLLLRDEMNDRELRIGPEGTMVGAAPGEGGSPLPGTGVVDRHLTLRLVDGRWQARRATDAPVLLGGVPIHDDGALLHVGSRLQIGELLLSVRRAHTGPAPAPPWEGKAFMLSPVVGELLCPRQIEGVKRPAWLPDGSINLQVLRQTAGRLTGRVAGTNLVLQRERIAKPGRGPRSWGVMLRAQVEARLAHPHLQRLAYAHWTDEVLDRYTVDTGGFSASELVDAQRARRERPPLGVVLRVIADVARALSWLHDGGDQPGGAPILHLDVRPGHVMVDLKGRAILLGFHAAFTPRFEIPRERLYSIDPVREPYVAPEFKRRAGPRSLDGSADVCALAVMTVELLTTDAPQHPFHARELLGDIADPALRALLHNALSDRIGERPSAAAFAALCEDKAAERAELARHLESLFGPSLVIERTPVSAVRVDDTEAL